MKTNYAKYILAVLLLVAGLTLRATAQDAAGNVVLGIVPQEREQQLTVQHVAADTPAAQAGIREGDTLLSIAGHAVTTRESLRRALEQIHAGEPAELRLLRGGSEITCTLTPALRASSLAAARPEGEDAELAERMRPIKDNIRKALANLPENADTAVIRESMQQLLQIAAENASVRGVGVLRLHDARGSLELSEQNGSLVLEAYDENGASAGSCPLDTAEQCRSIPDDLLARCRSLVSVEHYSRAERSGIRPADTVLSINGTQVTDDETLKHLLDTAPDGALVEVMRIDHPEVLELAPLDYTAPVRELKVDWDAEEAAEEAHEDARNALLWELSGEHPDNTAVLRAWKQLNPDGLMAFSDEHGTIYLFKDGGALTVKECGHLTPTKTYRSTMPLPEALRLRLRDFRN